MADNQRSGGQQKGGESSPGKFGSEQGMDPSEAGRMGGQSRGE